MSPSHFSEPEWPERLGNKSIECCCHVVFPQSSLVPGGGLFPGSDGRQVREVSETLR